jgi:hypothetical protein
VFKGFFETKFLRFLALTQFLHEFTALMLRVQLLFKCLHFVEIPIWIHDYVITECILCLLVHGLVLLPYLEIGANNLIPHIVKKMWTVYSSLIFKLRCRVETSNVLRIECRYHVRFCVFAWA